MECSNVKTDPWLVSCNVTRIYRTSEVSHDQTRFLKIVTVTWSADNAAQIRWRVIGHRGLEWGAKLQRCTLALKIDRHACDDELGA